MAYYQLKFPHFSRHVNKGYFETNFAYTGKLDDLQKIHLWSKNWGHVSRI